MRPIAPRIEGAEEVTVAEDQHEYKTLTMAIVQFSDRKYIIARYTFTDEERKQIAAGEDIYLGMIYGIPVMPPWLCVGSPIKE